MKKTHILIISILIILVLGLSGYIIYDKVLKKETGNNNYQENNNQTNDNNLNNNQTNHEENDNKEETHQITDKAIQDAFDLVGLPRTNSEGNTLLNYYVSNDDYSKYANEIISYYANDWNGKKLFKQVSVDVMNSDACGGSGFCMSISKKDAEKIFELYNFKGNINDYFKSTSKLENEYVFIVTNNSVPVIFNSPNAKITHNIETYNMGGTDIGATDKQTITIVDENDYSKLKTINKTVNYEFKMNKEGNYYLYKVEVAK